MAAYSDAAPAGGMRAAVKGLIPRSLVIRRLPAAAAPTILLTFDDGPHPVVTAAVLDRLAAHGARAVFFVVGRRLKRGGDLLARMRREGHLIGNHSYLHRNRYILTDGPQATLAEYYRDCARCQREILERSGAPARLFRPPGGRLNVTTMLVPKLLGLRCVTWSQDVHDWKFRRPDEARAGAEALLKAVGAGDIVLLHDDNASVLDLLDALLPQLKARGFDLASGAGLL